MGGWMQPQAHVQVVMNMIDWHLNPQQALDAPRWQWVGGKKVEVEQETPNYIIRQLQRMGHQIVVQPDPYHMGRGQVILRDENGVLCGATEKRYRRTDHCPTNQQRSRCQGVGTIDSGSGSLARPGFCLKIR